MHVNVGIAWCALNCDPLWGKVQLRATGCIHHPLGKTSSRYCEKLYPLLYLFAQERRQSAVAGAHRIPTNAGVSLPGEREWNT